MIDFMICAIFLGTMSLGFFILRIIINRINLKNLKKLEQIKQICISSGIAEYCKTTGKIYIKTTSGTCEYIYDVYGTDTIYEAIFNAAIVLGFIQYDVKTGKCLYKKSIYTDVLKQCDQSKLDLPSYMRENETYFSKLNYREKKL